MRHGTPARGTGQRFAEECRRLLEGEGPNCLSDATSLVGLAALKRRYPQDWHRVVQGAASGVPTATLLAWLVQGRTEDLFPKHAADKTFAPRRNAARMMVACLDDVRIAEIDERTLHRLACRFAERQACGSAHRIRRDASLLRRWVRQAQCSIGMTPRVRSRWRRVPLGVALPSNRSTLCLADVAEALRACRRLDIRAMIGLAVGGRLSTQEMESLSWKDVETDRCAVVVRSGDRRGTPRRLAGRTVVLPAWTWGLLMAWRESAPSSAWVFPHPRDPRRHRTRSDGRLRTLGRRLGRDDLSLAALRVFGQSVARGAGMCRAGVRGSVSNQASSDPRVVRKVEDEQARLAEAWRLLRSPPAVPRAFPRRAPSGCAPCEPELAASRRRIAKRFGEVVPPLPASCLLGGDEGSAWLEPSYRGLREGPERLSEWEDGAGVEARVEAQRPPPVPSRPTAMEMLERDNHELTQRLRRAERARDDSRAEVARRRAEDEFKLLLAFTGGGVAGYSIARLQSDPAARSRCGSSLRAVAASAEEDLSRRG